MIHAIAIDDEPKAIQVIQSHVSKIDSLVLIDHFYDPKKAIDFLKQNPIDLVFLDINMPNMSGLEMLLELQLQPYIVFTTAYADFALDSYTYNAVDYLLKPFEFERFQIAINKVEERVSNQEKQQTFFFIKDGFKNIKLQFDGILYIKGSGNYLDITTLKRVFSPRMTFIDIVERLPSSQFLRVHQSYIVNIQYIDKIESNHIHMGSHKIPISNRYKDTFFKRLDLG
jgi:two-component system, LytTR family, response regulator